MNMLAKFPTKAENHHVAEAVSFAAECHRLQVDKGGKPYILHPLAVMGMCDNNIDRIAAVLHDVVEDCGVSLLAIRLHWGDEIADGVDACSRREGETYGEFITRGRQNEVCCRVKPRDILHNLSPERVADLPEDEARGMDKRYRRSLAMFRNPGLTWAESVVYQNDPVMI